MVEQELQLTGVITAFFSFVVILVNIIYKLNISGEISCFGLIFSVRRSENTNIQGNTSNSNINVANNQNNNTVQEVELEIHSTV